MSERDAWRRWGEAVAIVRRMHELEVAGLGDSPEADAIRDASDPLWLAMSEAERAKLWRFSEALWKDPPAPGVSR
jgi:hypothetical protein